MTKNQREQSLSMGHVSVKLTAGTAVNNRPRERTHHLAISKTHPNCHESTANYSVTQHMAHHNCQVSFNTSVTLQSSHILTYADDIKPTSTHKHKLKTTWSMTDKLQPATDKQNAKVLRLNSKFPVIQPENKSIS